MYKIYRKRYIIMNGSQSVINNIYAVFQLIFPTICFIFVFSFNCFFFISPVALFVCFSFSWVRVSVLTIIFVSDFHSFISMQSDFVYFPFCSIACKCECECVAWRKTCSTNTIYVCYGYFLGDRIHPVLLVVVVLHIHITFTILLSKYFRPIYKHLLVFLLFATPF